MYIDFGNKASRFDYDRLDKHVNKINIDLTQLVLAPMNWECNLFMNN